MYAKPAVHYMKKGLHKDEQKIDMYVCINFEMPTLPTGICMC